MPNPAAHVYCVDTSALIDLPLHYPSKVFNDTVWRSMEVLISTARLRAPREVRRELAKQEGDEVHRWVKRHSNLIVGLPPKQQTLLKEIMDRFPTWVDYETAQPVADPVLIALARSYNPPAVVLTHERPGGAGAMKIPNACAHCGITYMTLPQMFVAEGWSFVSALGTRRSCRTRVTQGRDDAHHTPLSTNVSTICGRSGRAMARTELRMMPTFSYEAPDSCLGETTSH